MIQNKYSILSFDSFWKFWRCHKNIADWQVINNNKAKFGNEILTRLNPNNSFWTLSLSADGWWPLPMMNLSILAFFSSMMGCCCFLTLFTSRNFENLFLPNVQIKLWEFGLHFWEITLFHLLFFSVSSLGTSPSSFSGSFGTSEKLLKLPWK